MVIKFVGMRHDARMTVDQPRPVFSAAVAEMYDELLVPMLFEPYAASLCNCLADLTDGSVLEIAAGTGAVTRVMANRLPVTVEITATDLSPDMVARAARVGTARPVTWDTADVMELPFADASFDAVVCQFGVMFFDPKVAAFTEVRRVLRPGGTFAFLVWDGMDDNEFADVVVRSLGEMFPDEPLNFVERIPHGYHDPETIRADLGAAGFTAEPTLERIVLTSRAGSAADVATAYCLGTPMRGELEQRRAGCTADAVTRSTAAVEERFGATGLEGRMSAQLVWVTSP